METSHIDSFQLALNPGGLVAMNMVIGLMMFGMALDLKITDFKRILLAPKAPLIGLLAQFIILPALTFCLTLFLNAPPSVLLGMILVAACPGGNLSNLMTYLARGNAAVSISMTAISSSAAVIMTPFNVAIWGSLNPKTEPILRAVSLDPTDVFKTVFLILGIPLIAGILVSNRWPSLVEKVRHPFKVLSVIVFLSVVALALAANGAIFFEALGMIMGVVFLHNAVALSTGYFGVAFFLGGCTGTFGLTGTKAIDVWKAWVHEQPAPLSGAKRSPPAGIWPSQQLPRTPTHSVRLFVSRSSMPWYSKRWKMAFAEAAIVPQPW